MKKLILLALSGVLLASLSGCGSAKAADADYIYGQIDSVSGNDIVLLLADYHENAESGDAGKEKTAEDSGSEKTKRQRPENGEMPEGFDPSKFSGEMPEGFDPSQFGGKMPGGSSRSGG